MIALTSQLTIAVTASPPPAAATMMPATRPMPIEISHAITIVPNTCQPCPRTSSRLRPKAANTPGFSSTTTGTTTDQMVIRIRPGMMISSRPMAIAMPARMATASSCQNTAETPVKSELVSSSRRPSSRSWTRRTTPPV